MYQHLRGPLRFASSVYTGVLLCKLMTAEGFEDRRQIVDQVKQAFPDNSERKMSFNSCNNVFSDAAPTQKIYEK